MKDNTITTIILAGLALGILNRAARRRPAMSGLSSYSPYGYNLQGIPTKKEIIHLLTNTKTQLSVNDEILSDGNGNYYLSATLSRRTGLPTPETQAPF